VEGFVEKFYGVALDGEFGVAEEGEALRLRGVGEVDEGANPLAGLWFEGAAEEAGEAERRESAAGGLFLDGHLRRLLRAGRVRRCKKLPREFGISTAAEVP